MLESLSVLLNNMTTAQPTLATTLPLPPSHFSLLYSFMINLILIKLQYALEFLHSFIFCLFFLGGVWGGGGIVIFVEMLE